MNAPSCASSSGQQTRIGIVLLNFGGCRDTLACLDSLLLGTEGFAWLVIAENGSPGNDLNELRQGLADRQSALANARTRWLMPGEVPLWSERDRLQVSKAPDLLDGPRSWVTLLDNRANLGFAGGNNVALELLLRDRTLTHFWLLNNDTEVLPDTIARAVSAANRRPEMDLWGHTLVYHHRPQEVQALGGGAMKGRAGETRHLGAFTDVASVSADADFVARIEAEMDYVLGASMWATRKWLEVVGLLSEDYFLYYEELDWAQRGRALGLRLGYAPDVVVRHKEGASIGTTPSGGSTFSVRQLARSRVLFCRKFLAPGARWWLVLSVAKITAKLALKGRWPQARAAWAGTLDGWKAAEARHK